MNERMVPEGIDSAAFVAVERRVEYRAIYRVPWSILNPQEYRERGWMEYESGYGTDREQIRKAVMSRSVEDHQYIVRWEKRTVLVGPWEEETK